MYFHVKIGQKVCNYIPYGGKYNGDSLILLNQFC